MRAGAVFPFPQELLTPAAALDEARRATDSAPDLADPGGCPTALCGPVVEEAGYPLDIDPVASEIPEGSIFVARRDILIPVGRAHVHLSSANCTLNIRQSAEFIRVIPRGTEFALKERSGWWGPTRLWFDHREVFQLACAPTVPLSKVRRSGEFDVRLAPPAPLDSRSPADRHPKP